MRFELPVQATFTRGKLARLVGLTDDLAAHWVKEGLIVSVTPGRGTGLHREFSVFQVHKAAVLRFLRGMGCNIASLRWFAETLDRGSSIADCYPDLRQRDVHTARGLSRRLEKFDAGEARIWDHESNPPPPRSRRAAVTADEVIADYFRAEDVGTNRDLIMQVVADLKDRPSDMLALDLFADLMTEGLYERGSLSEIVWLASPADEGWLVQQSYEADNLSGLKDIDGGFYINVGRLIRKIWNA